MKKELREIFNYKQINPEFPLHAFHAYPCKFPAFIPREIIKRFAVKGDVVCDPFVGSGTTLLEASLLGYSSIGNDINPLSCLLARVKAKPIKKIILNKIDFLTKTLIEEYKGKKNIELFYYDSVDHWFSKDVIRQLSFLKEKISEEPHGDLRDLLHIILSAILVKVSNQESDTRYAAISKKQKDLGALNAFICKAIEAKKIYLDFDAKAQEVDVKVLNSDGRDLKGIKKSSVDLIITSPPYANTYDYYLYHKHRKFWLGMDVKYAQLNEIGSRREFSSLKEVPQKWNDDLRKCLLEMKRIVKVGGLIFIIIGDSVINKKIIKAEKMIQALSVDVGLEFMDVVSAPLSKHSKMFNPRFATKFAKEEHLVLLRK